MPSTPANADSAPAAASARATVLEVAGLTVTFETAQGLITAANDVTLAVARGECLGVVGESGAGKSQVFLALLGLLAANGHAAGSAWFLGKELLSLGAAELDSVRGSGIGLVFQDPMTSLTPHRSVGEQITEVMLRHLGLTRPEARARALTLLERVQVTDPEQRLRQFPHELSGGMRQRVMIAIALACGPQLLIADEPTTSLDVTVQAQILALLAQLKREQAMAMVLITHDLGAVAGLADRVAVMRAGRIIETGSVAQVLKAPREAYTAALLREARAGEAGEPVPAPAPASVDGVELTVSDLSVEFALRRAWPRRAARLTAVSAVSLTLGRGEALAVVGESGSGKSTLARAILALLPASSGRVVWLGRDLTGLKPPELRSLRQDLQIIFQDPLGSLDPRMTVGEIVAEPLEVHSPGLSAASRQAAVAHMLERVGLSSRLAGRYPHELSGGECQRTGIARAMILKPRLLVCDEPVSALDAPTQRQIVALLGGLKSEQGLTLLFVSHNLALVRALCERVLVMYLGRMMELAPVPELFAQPLHPYARELLGAIPVADPDVQPGRLAGARPGEPPSLLAPPSGCVYRTRCLHALAVCGERPPVWEAAGGGRGVACHRWRELT
jgi:oligopeptide/dipeptide ABC transporter ATP-binding protein